jgi:hypothetical protein
VERGGSSTKVDTAAAAAAAAVAVVAVPTALPRSSPPSFSRSLH